MAAFLAIVLGLPTVIFTVLMGFVALYWLLVMVGALDLDLFDLDLDLDLDVDVDPGLDGALEGASGAADALDAVDAVDVADVADVADAADAVDLADAADAADAAEGAGAFAQFLAFLGFGRVPVMVLFSLFVLAGFILSFLGSWAFGPFTGSALVLAVGSGSVLGVAFVGGLLTAAAISRPLSPLFRTGRSRERRSLIGELVELDTGRVDGGFGQGIVLVTDADLLVQIRCDHDNGLSRGDRALIVSFDAARDAFIVEPTQPRELEDRQAHRAARATPTTS